MWERPFTCAGGRAATFRVSGCAGASCRASTRPAASCSVSSRHCVCCHPGCLATAQAATQLQSCTAGGQHPAQTTVHQSSAPGTCASGRQRCAPGQAGRWLAACSRLRSSDAAATNAATPAAGSARPGCCAAPPRCNARAKQWLELQDAGHAADCSTTSHDDLPCATDNPDAAKHWQDGDVSSSGPLQLLLVRFCRLRQLHRFLPQTRQLTLLVCCNVLQPLGMLHGAYRKGVGQRRGFCCTSLHLLLQCLQACTGMQGHIVPRVLAAQ